MFNVFEFDLPGTVTNQLEKRLRAMPSSTLTAHALQELAQFQEQHKLSQGVYQLLLNDEVVFVWKATDVRRRLEQHFWKLRGRQNVRTEDVRFRCLMLHANWRTMADEDLLISHYRAKGQCKWNSASFSVKDVGKARDSTVPNWFDREYPINADYPCSDIPDRTTVGELLQSLKRQLPFTFRYAVHRSDAALQLDLKSAPRTARALISRAVKSLGSEWQATLFLSHITLYKSQRAYEHGEVIKPS